MSMKAKCPECSGVGCRRCYGTGFVFPVHERITLLEADRDQHLATIRTMTADLEQAKESKTWLESRVQELADALDEQAKLAEKAAETAEKADQGIQAARIVAEAVLLAEWKSRQRGIPRGLDEQKVAEAMANICYQVRQITEGVTGVTMTGPDR